MIYRSNIATLNQLKEWYKSFNTIRSVSIFDRKINLIIKWDIKNKAEYQFPCEFNIDYNKELYIVETKRIKNEAYDYRVYIIIDFNDELAHYQHDICRELHFLDSFYYFYSNKGIKSIDLYVDMKDKETSESKSICLFNIDLTCDNINDAIVPSDIDIFDYSNSLRYQISDKISKIFEPMDNWIIHTVGYMNGFRFDQYENDDGTTDEKLSIYLDDIIHLSE